jgi:YfiH family protein
VVWLVERWRTVPGLLHGFGGRGEAGPPGVVTLRQVHGRTVLRAEEVQPRSEGDGLIAARPGLRIGVWTADCVPVALVAPEERVAAIVHCGWRGTAAGTVVEAVERLGSDFGIRPHSVEAALGPAIGGCCYEVGEEVVETLRAHLGQLVDAGLRPGGRRPKLDLRAVLGAVLRSVGVAAIEQVGPCTACRCDLLHSYRQERSGGRQLSWIGWD